MDLHLFVILFHFERKSERLYSFFFLFFFGNRKKLDSISKWKQRQGPGQTVLLSFLFEQLGNNSVLYWKWLAAIRRLFIHRRREPRRSFFFLFFFDYFSLMKGPKLVHSVARSHYYGKKKKKEKPLLTRPSSRGNPSKNLNETSKKVDKTGFKKKTNILTYSIALKPNRNWEFILLGNPVKTR